MKLILSSVLLFSSFAFSAYKLPADQVFDIWPTIPFVRGADLCQYKDAYGQSRTEYVSQMAKQASNMTAAGMEGPDAIDGLIAFSLLYDRNLDLAIKYNYLDVTLESTLKAYIDQYYHQLNPKNKKLSFKTVNDLVNVINAAKIGQRDGYLDSNLISKLDFISYGTYTLAPNCAGDIQVTLHLLGRDGRQESFIGTGSPATVMSQIASQMFEMFQRTQFPSKVKIGVKNLTLVGGLNGSVDRVTDPRLAEEICSTLNARMPTRLEMEILNSYGDWSGGISLNNEVWAMPENKVYAPYLKNPTPIRERWEVNAQEYLYYCVK